MESAGGLGTGGVDALKKMVEGINFAILDQYKDVSGVKPGETNISKTITDFLTQGSEGLSAFFGLNKGTETPKTNTVNLNANVDIKGESSNMTKDNFRVMLESVIGEISNDPAVMSKIKDGIEKVSNSSGMAK